MTTYGVTPTGFVKKPLSTIKTEIEEYQRDQIDSNLNQLATALFGQINGVVGDKLRECWDVLEAVYRAAYPDSASDEALDQVLAITGAIRLAARKTQVVLDQLFLDGGTTVLAGSLVKVGATGVQYEILEDVTNPLGYPDTVSAPAEATETGPNPGYAGTIDTIQTPVGGWSAKPAVSNTIAEPYALDGKSLSLRLNNLLGGGEFSIPFSGGNPWSASDVVDRINTEILNYTEDGEAYLIDSDIRLRIASTLEGPGTEVYVTGGSAAALLGFPTVSIRGFNSEDGEPGRDLETDEEARIRREQLLQVAGAATVEAIRADLLRVTNVLQALVRENTTLVPDILGIPGKAFRSVVQGGTDEDIAEAIWLTKPAGIEADGSITEVVTDSMGFTHDIKFSRPVEVPIYIDLTLTTDGDFPVDGVDQVKAALVAFGDLLRIGDDVIALQFKAVPLEIDGVVDVTVFEIDTSSPPVGTVNISIDTLERATFDVADIRIPNP